VTDDEHRAKPKRNRAREREQAKAVSPFAHAVIKNRQSQDQQRKALIGQMRGTARNTDGTLQRPPPAITLPTIKAPTLEEIEEKYGRGE
jgi:hypothetical protein